MTWQDVKKCCTVVKIKSKENVMKLTPVSVNLQIGQIKVESQLHDELVIKDYNDLEKHLNEISAKFAYWGVLHAEAKKELDALKIEYKKWMAEKKREVENGKKFTSETAKEDAVNLGNVEAYALMNKRIIDADYNLNILDVVKDAWIMKKDMLITLSAQMRQEASASTIENIKNNWNSKLK
jgi:uncharacterized protein YecT (DUF1311 family)